MISRRALLTGSLGIAITASACKTNNSASPDPPRCSFCGMKIDPASPWRSEIADGKAVTPFDSPKCALLYSHEHTLGPSATLRFQEFYTRQWRSGADLVFVLGSDVVGPMGNDAIPVDRAHATQFVHDHGTIAPPRTRELSALRQDELRAL